MKLRNYVVHNEGYMCEDADTYTVKAKNDTEALQEILDWDDNKEDYDTWEEYLDDCESANGDGMPYISVFSVEDEETIFGK